MLRKIIFIFILLMILPIQYKSALDLESIQDNDINIILVYSNQDGKVNETINQLTTLLHHYTDNLTLVSDEQLEKNDLKQATHLIYFGEDEKGLKKHVVHMIDDFAGPLIFFGENINQFNRLDTISTNESVKISRINNLDNDQSFLLRDHVSIKKVNSLEQFNVLLAGYKGKNSFPLVMKKEETYYIALTNLINLDPYLTNYLAEFFHQIFPNEHHGEYLAFLKLVEINPLTNPDELQKIGLFLSKKQIPYLLSVNPFAIDVKRDEELSLSDSPELIKTLQYLQQKDGTIIIDGWQYIAEAAENEQDDTQNMYSKDMFTNEEAYHHYQKSFINEKQRQIEAKLEDLFNEFLVHQLYPLSFDFRSDLQLDVEKKLLTNYFSSLFGDGPFRNENSESLSVPFITINAQFNDVMLFSSDLELIDLETQNQSYLFNEKIEQAQIIQDSLIGVSFNSSLGIEQLNMIMSKLNVNWLNLSKTEQFAHLSRIHITSSKNSDLHVSYDYEQIQIYKDQQQKSEPSLLEKILWLVTLFVLVFILLFILITLYLRTQFKKRLFKERTEDG